MAIITLHGWEAAAVSVGQAAVERATKLRAHIPISDMVMTRMDGTDAGNQIRGLVPDFQVVLLSGRTATPDLVAAAERCGHSFEILIEPIDPKLLLAKAGRLAGRP